MNTPLLINLFVKIEQVYDNNNELANIYEAE